MFDKETNGRFGWVAGLAVVAGMAADTLGLTEAWQKLVLTAGVAILAVIIDRGMFKVKDSEKPTE